MPLSTLKHGFQDFPALCLYSQNDSLLRKKKEAYGYSLLTDQSGFYRENYPQAVIEKSGLDELILLMVKGEEL